MDGMNLVGLLFLACLLILFITVLTAFDNSGRITKQERESKLIRSDMYDLKLRIVELEKAPGSHDDDKNTIKKFVKKYEKDDHTLSVMLNMLGAARDRYRAHINAFNSESSPAAMELSKCHTCEDVIESRSGGLHMTLRVVLCNGLKFCSNKCKDVYLTKQTGLIEQLPKCCYKDCKKPINRSLGTIFLNDRDSSCCCDKNCYEKWKLSQPRGNPITCQKCHRIINLSDKTVKLSEIGFEEKKDRYCCDKVCWENWAKNKTL